MSQAFLYPHVFKVGLQNALVYRWNFFLRCIFSFAPLAGTFFFWGAIYGSKESVAGYDFAGMLTYFVALLVLDAATSPTEDDFQIASDIRDGFINQVLLKPVNYLVYRLVLFFSGRAVYLVSTALPVGAVVVFMREHLTAPERPELWALAIAATLGSALIQFGIAFCTGLSAFWLSEVGTVIFMIYGLEYVLGGHMFPLDLLPATLYQVALLLPFAYEYYFPTAIFCGRLSDTEIARGFAMQLFWVLAQVVVSRWIWAKGLRSYTAVGG